MRQEYFIDFLMLLLTTALWICFNDSFFVILGTIALLLSVCVIIIDAFEIYDRYKHKSDENSMFR